MQGRYQPLCLAMLLAANVSAAPADVAGLLKAGLPLGGKTLRQAVRATPLAPGVTHYEIKRGLESRTATWTLLADVATDDDAEAKARRCFAGIGLQARVDSYTIPGDSAPYRIVSGGSYAGRAQAADKAAEAKECRLTPRHTSEDEANADGPWDIDVLAIDPRRAHGSLTAVAAGRDGSLRRTTTDLANAAHALAGVNAGFFVEKDIDGYPGQPAGISILSGRLNSAPVDKRPAVLLPGGVKPAVRILPAVDWQAALEWDGGRVTVDGVNRRQGLVRNCGRGDAPVHDHTCSYADDVVYFPPGSRFMADSGGEARFALAADGRLRELAQGTLPGEGEAMLAAGAAGERTAQLRAQVQRGAAAKFAVRSSVFEAGPAVSVVNAGPTLVRDGAPVHADAQEGWSMLTLADPAHRNLMHDWITRRNPRTAIGVRRDGVILLIAVDGHRHAESVGLSIEELRRVAAYLGAQDAVNLDGGGSTAMVLKGRLANHPSDAAGERKVGDAIVFTPSK
jgi:exopolysaccharide biosynthesis protein